MQNAQTEHPEITPCLWYSHNAEEAVNLYTSVFRNSKVACITYYGKNDPMPEGTVKTITFVLDEQKFMALNAGSSFTFSEAVPFLVDCDTQQELDELMINLSAGGQIEKFGWLQDRFGISWQIIPSVMEKMLRDKEKGDKVIRAAMKMKKIDLKTIKETYNG